MGTPSNSPDSSWVAYNSTQFCHSLPRDSIRFHRLKAEFLKTEQTLFLQMPITNPGYHLYFWLSSSINRLEVLMTPSSESINFLGRITELREIFYLLDSFQFSHSVMSDSLQPHRLQHTRLPCPSPTPRAYSNSCPSSQWCHPTISSSVIPFSSRLQSFPASGSFPRSQFFASDGQCIWSFSFRISPSNEYSELTDFF